MKIAFTTLGCPDWSFDRILEEAQTMGFDGIEIRGLGGKMRAEEMVAFFPENVAETQRKLEKHGLVITSFGASCSFHDAGKIPAALEEGRAAIDVCSRMGIPAIRVFGDTIPEDTDEAVIIEQVVAGIQALCEYGKDKNVQVWIETHGMFNTVERIKAVTEGVAMKNFGILWDIEHTDKVYGADFVQFYGPMKPYIRHLHTKDHRRENGAFILTLPGEGEIPIIEIIQKLEADGFKGFYSLEWEKKWQPHLPEPEIAFPAYMALVEKAR